MRRIQKWGLALAALLGAFVVYSLTYEPKAQELETTRRHTESVYHVEFSPDAKHMLWLSDQASYLFDVSSLSNHYLAQVWSQPWPVPLGGWCNNDVIEVSSDGRTAKTAYTIKFTQAGQPLSPVLKQRLSTLGFIGTSDADNGQNHQFELPLSLTGQRQPREAFLKPSWTQGVPFFGCKDGVAIQQQLNAQELASQARWMPLNKLGEGLQYLFFMVYLLLSGQSPLPRG